MIFGRSNCLVLALLCSVLAGGALHAAFTNTQGPYNITGPTLGEVFFDVDFGATAHTETFNLQLGCDQASGILVFFTDCDATASAASAAAFNAANPGWQFAGTTPGTMQLAGGATYTTPSYSGVHRFFYTFQNLNAAPFPENVQVNIDNGTGAGTLIGGTTTLHSWSQTNIISGLGASTLSTGRQRHYLMQAYGFGTMGAGTDSVTLDFQFDFGVTSAARKISLYCNNFQAAGQTGTGQINYELYNLTEDGGATPRFTVSSTTTGTTATEACNTHTTLAHTSNQTFRVVVKGGTPYVATQSYFFVISIDTGGTLNATTATGLPPPITSAPKVAYQTPTPAAGALAGGTTGVAYASQTFSATGGTGNPATWVYSVSSGALPGGLALAPLTAAATATLSGTPTAAGSFSFSIRATNTATGYTTEWIERAYTLNVVVGSGPLLTVSTNTVTVPTTTAGTAGTAGSFTVSGSNLTPASGSVTLTLTTGSADIEFRNATAAGTFGTGVVTINYTGSAFAAQTIEVRFRAVATAGAKTGSITIAGGGAANVVVNLSGTVNAAGTPTLIVSTNTVTVPATTAGTAGTATSFTVSGTNLTPASGNVTLTLTTGGPDIQFRNATAAGTFGTGVVTIAYTGGAFAAQTIEVRFAAAATAGAKTGSITISGGGATNQVVNLSGTVNSGAALSIITTTLPNGTVGTAYNGTITAQNGTGPYTWSIASGTLPAGLTLNTAATGLTTSITGTPTVAGPATFTIQVSDSAAGSDTQLYNITINAAGTGGGTIGGGGGGGGCSADAAVSPWFLLAAVAGLVLVAARRRRLA